MLLCIIPLPQPKSLPHQLLSGLSLGHSHWITQISQQHSCCHYSGTAMVAKLDIQSAQDRSLKTQKQKHEAMPLCKQRSEMVSNFTPLAAGFCHLAIGKACLAQMPEEHTTSVTVILQLRTFQQATICFRSGLQHWMSTPRIVWRGTEVVWGVGADMSPASPFQQTRILGVRKGHDL